MSDSDSPSTTCLLTALQTSLCLKMLTTIGCQLKIMVTTANTKNCMTALSLTTAKY